MALVEHMLDMHACGVRSCGGKSSSIRSWQRNRGSAGHLVFLHAVIAVLNRSSSPIIVIEIGEIVEERVSKVRHAEWRSAITLAPKIKNKFIFIFCPLIQFSGRCSGVCLGRADSDMPMPMAKRTNMEKRSGKSTGACASRSQLKTTCPCGRQS